MVWPAVVYLGPNPDAFDRAFRRLGHVRHPPSDWGRWLAERSFLQEQWDLLALEEERVSGASQMPERNFVAEGVHWDRARLDEEWSNSAPRTAGLRDERQARHRPKPQPSPARRPRSSPSSRRTRQ